MTAPKFPEDWPHQVWTPDEWHQAMLYRLDAWLEKQQHEDITSAKDLLKHMAMNLDEFTHWRETGEVPRVARVFFTLFPEYMYTSLPEHIHV